MSVPRRFEYPSIAELPSCEEILSQLDRQHHVVLRFPAKQESQKADLIRSLKANLPEYCSVFDSGGKGNLTWVTIMQVISRPELKAIEAELIHGARAFRQTANQLSTELAWFNEVDIEKLWEHGNDLKTFHQDWSIFPHGGHVCFKHTRTNQEVEASVWFGTEFGILDPQFFTTFLRTSPQLECPREILDTFHDMAKAMDYLESEGHLQRIEGAFNLTGVFAPFAVDSVTDRSKG